MEMLLIDQALNLFNQIKYHDELFFIKNESEISDSEYDLLKAQLASLLQDNVSLQKELEELTRGDEKGVSLFETKTLLTVVDHHRPFISLRRTYDFNQVEFYERLFKDYYIETKLDGLAIELIYRYGKLDKVLTKGTHTKGEDVTHNKRLFKSLPELIPECRDIPVFDIRCEAHLTFDDIAALKERGVKIKKQRNQVSGWIRSKEPTRTAHGMITLSAYEASSELIKLLKFKTATDVRNWLASKEFSIPDLVSKKDMLNHVRNKTAPFDGYIMKANDFTYHERVDRPNEAPVSCIAFKYNTLFGESEAIQVIWSVNKSQIVPRLAYKQTIIDDSVCTFANLFNAGNFIRMKLGEGDKIRIVMGGDCVPHLSAVIERSDNPRFTMPSQCPCCKGPVSKIGPTLVCNNTEGCADQLLTALNKAVGAEGFDIKGIGPNTLEDWVGQGWIKTPRDLFHLEQSQIANRHYDAIQNARRITLSRFIYSLCIDEIGIGVANKISEKVVTIEGFLEFIKKPDEVKELLTPARALALLTAVNDKKTSRYIESFAAALSIRPDVNKSNLIPIVITGTFDTPRNVMCELLLKSGIEVVIRVTKSTKCVLVGTRQFDTETASMATAKKLGIPMIMVSNDTSYNDIVKEIKQYG